MYFIDFSWFRMSQSRGSSSCYQIVVRET